MITLDSKTIRAPCSHLAVRSTTTANKQPTLSVTRDTKELEKTSEKMKEENKAWGRNVSIFSLFMSPKRSVRSPLISAWYLGPLHRSVRHQELVKTAEAL